MKLLISNYHIKNRNLSFPASALLQHPVHSLTWLRPQGVQPAQRFAKAKPNRLCELCCYIQGQLRTKLFICPYISPPIQLVLPE